MFLPQGTCLSNHAEHKIVGLSPYHCDELRSHEVDAGKDSSLTSIPYSTQPFMLKHIVESRRYRVSGLLS